jgi:steroid 5-alpha reductase family enzyme
MQTLPLIAVGLVVMIGFMSSAWIFQRAVGNAGWIDVFWTFGTGVLGVIFSLTPVPGESGPHIRQIAVALLAASWSLRLGLHVALRVAGGVEDIRYQDLRRDWGRDFQRRLFWFVEAQAPIGLMLGLAMLAAARNPAPGFRVQDALAVLVLAGAVFGEGLADRQLGRFRADPANRGKICEVGLWRYSRHPNYFFEWLGWCAYPLFAIAPGAHYPWGWLALAAPAAMYWVLVKATGIPPTEAAMLRSRGDAFRDYQRRTSAFFPLPPRA